MGEKKKMEAFRLVFPSVHGNCGWAGYKVVDEGTLEELMSYKLKSHSGNNEIDRDNKVIAAHYSELDYCSCGHDTFFPAILDGDGKIVARVTFNEDTEYLEWKIEKDEK